MRTMSVDIPKDAPSPRLCLVVKTNSSQEYGYNLHAERGKPQFIGTVDPDSPADRAGLRPGDRIFAVNGHSIIGENHKQVVQRIKENPLQCELLVISEDGADWYKEHNISVTLSLPNIVRSATSYLRKESDSISQESRKSLKEEQQNSSPTPDAHWYAPKEQEKERAIQSPHKRTTDAMIANKPRPRLCRLEKSSPSDEFGFNLHAERSRGHFVGAVDKGGIGELAGLEMGQRIVGVNGSLIYPTTPHKEVVGLIKMNPLQTDLLVASEEVDRWYSENNQQFSFDYVDHYKHSSDSASSRKETGSGRSSSSEQERSVHSDSISGRSIPSKKEEMESNREHVAGIFSRLALEDAPVGTLERERELIEPDVVRASVATNPDLVFTHRRNDSEMHNGTTPSHHANGHMSAAVPFIEKDAELPTQPLSHHVQQHSDSSPATKVTASVAPIRQPSPTRQRDDDSIRSSEKGDKHGQQGDDIFLMSAKEARSMLVHRKKDPRRDVHMTLDEKYKLITNM